MTGQPRNDVFRKRTAALTVFLLMALAALTARLFVLQVARGGEARRAAESQHTIYRKLLASRGQIDLVDRSTLQTVTVATNVKKYLAYAVPADIPNAAAQAERLAEVLGMPPEELLPKLLQNDRKYVPLKKQLSEQEQGQLERLALPGIYLDSEETRFYPEGSLLSHVLGFVGYGSTDDKKKVGLYGLERNFEQELAGQNGSLYEEKDAGGAWIFGAKRQRSPAVDGVNLLLTIDKTLQFQAESVIREAVNRHAADSGSVIIADPKTGAIWAMAGYPDFDPNAFNKTSDPGNYNNQAATGSYEPGSTFKAITMAAAIDSGKLSPDTVYVDEGKVEVDNYTIRNAEGGAHGEQTMAQALNLSLNTGAIFALNQLGNQDFLRYLRRFGFGKKTGIELPETAGSLDNLKGNITVNYYTASFGQGISATPIQMIQAYSALANGGKMMKPYLVQSKIFPGGKTEVFEPQSAGEPISARAANAVTAMLIDVVEKGYGKKAGVPGYFIAGKTGTSQVPRKDGKPGYEKDDNIGSFIGYGPAEDPKFLMLVRINHPRDVKFAESTAAPAFGQLAQFILNYLHVPPNRQ